MFNTRQNFHHSKLPAIGEVFKMPEQLLRGQFNPKDKFITVSYNLCDNIRPYSIGIHLVNIRSLRTGKLHTISGFWVVGQLD